MAVKSHGILEIMGKCTCDQNIHEILSNTQNTLEYKLNKNPRDNYQDHLTIRPTGMSQNTRLSYTIKSTGKIISIRLLAEI